MGGELAGVQAQYLALEHRREEQRAVGEEAQARRAAARELEHGLEVAINVDGVDALAVHVGEPEAVAVPTRPLSEHQVVHQQLRFAHASVRYRYDPTGRRVPPAERPPPTLTSMKVGLTLGGPEA